LIGELDVRTSTAVVVATITLKGKAAGTIKLDFRGVSSLPDGVRVGDTNERAVAAEGHDSTIIVTGGGLPIAPPPTLPAP
jgi:hypothetical protein